MTVYAQLPPVYSSVRFKNNTTYNLLTPIGDQDFSKPAIIFCHGGPLTPFPPRLLSDNLEGTGQMSTSTGGSIFGALITAGYRIYCPFFGPNWGAPTCPFPRATGTTAIDDTVLAANADGHPTDKVLVLGSSMGGCNMLTWSVNNQSKVVGAFGEVPLVDIKDAYYLSLWGKQVAPSVDFQYGASWNTDCTPYNPADNTASWNSTIGSKIKCIWSEDDPVVRLATTTAFAAAVPSITAVFRNGVNHFPFLHVDWNDYEAVDWFNQKAEEYYATI